MVNGFDSFREKFRGYEDCYTIIGGTVCTILMDEVGMGFANVKNCDAISKNRGAGEGRMWSRKNCKCGI